MTDPLQGALDEKLLARASHPDQPPRSICPDTCLCCRGLLIASRAGPVKAVVWHANTQTKVDTRLPVLSRSWAWWPPTMSRILLAGPNQLPGSWRQGSNYSTRNPMRAVESRPPLTLSEDFFSPGLLDLFVSQSDDGSRLYLLVVVPPSRPPTSVLLALCIPVQSATGCSLGHRLPSPAPGNRVWPRSTRLAGE